MTTPQAARETAGNAPQPDVDTSIPYLRPGQLVSLIRWTHSDGEWHYTTFLAEYVRRDPLYWHLVFHGEPTRLERSEWAIFN